MSEMKENRFRRIAGARVNKIINMLKLLGNCSHTGNYSYTKQQVEEIFGRLRSEVDEAYKRYQMCMKNAHLFSLSEESESAYPSASLSSAIRRFEKGLSPETMNTIWNVVFGLTYLNYDTEQDFTEQFSDNAAKVMKLISMAEGTKGES